MKLKKYIHLAPWGIGIGLMFLFGLIYFHNHSFGAWGDDSPGYIYMAGRLVRGESLIYQDTLAKQGLTAFQDERLARWLRPLHYEFINPDGWIAPRYPIGIAFFLAFGAIITNDLSGLYLVVPLLATLNVGLVFWLAAILLDFNRYRWLIAAISAWALGITTLYYELALSQPMREIPTLTFILFTILALLYWKKNLTAPTQKKKLWLLLLSALALGIAINIRETAIVMLPGIIIYIVLSVRSHKNKKWVVARYLGTYVVTCLIVLLPTIYTAIRLDVLQTPFKRRDVVVPSVVPNIDHITSIGLRNLFNDYGKFRPGHGALPHYWGVMSDITPLPWFLFFTLLGAVLLWQHSKKDSWLLVSWLVSILLMFSVWINPYSRYIIPLFPAVIILGYFGVIQLLDLIVSYLPLKKFQFLIVSGLVIIGSAILYQPAASKLQHQFTTETYFSRSISHKDLRTLIILGDQLQTASGAPPLLLFTGSRHGLPEVFTTHTGIRTASLPLESRFSPSTEELNTFFSEHIFPNYTVYLWVDTTTDPTINDWFNQYQVQEIANIQLSFEKKIVLLKID